MPNNVNPINTYVPMPLMPPDGMEWRPVEWPGVVPGYQVSLHGEVLSPLGNRITPQVRKNKQIVAVRMEGSANSTSVQVAQLVLSMFDRPAPDLVPAYRDGDQSNCQLTNLFWREPTGYEARSKKAIATARSKGRVTRAKKVTAAPAAPEASPRAVPRVEMFRTYRAGGLEVLVTPAGEIPAKGLPQGKLTPAKVAALSEILKDVVEMNSLVGVE